jgi:hypothetical protein
MVRSTATHAITLEWTKCLRGPADLPDALVRLVPVLLQVADQLQLEQRGVVVACEAGHVREVQGLGDLAVHVELELVRGAVADAHRTRVLVAGQPVELRLAQLAFARDAVHDLQVLGVAGDGPQ